MVCTVCDHLHVITGVLAYPKPFLWQQAWWVPFLFAAASLFVVAAARPILVAFGGTDDRPPAAREVAGDGILFVTAYAFTAYGHALPSVVLAVLVAWWLGRVVRGRRFWLVPYSLAAAVGGTLFEAGLSATGAFHYLVPDFLGVPMWLPALYLHVALLSGPLHVLVAKRAE
jgi:hypothetical protein